MNSKAQLKEDTARNLETNLKTMQRAHGSKWSQILADLTPVIKDIMKREGTTNPLKAILPVAKQMDADGKSPSVLLAVATHLATEPK